VTALYRISGSPWVTYRSLYSDVRQGQWYSNAVIWAHENGIADGIGYGEFDPYGSVTREQLATMLHRYAQFRGFNTTIPGNQGILNHFPDNWQVNHWAREAVSWAVWIGLIGGNDYGDLQPRAATTRAEGAAILHRFNMRYW
jgi:hypothetical protein